MPSVRIKDESNVEFAIRKFRRACEKAGNLAIARRRVAHEKPTTERKRKKAAAVKRYIKKLQREAPQPRDIREHRRKQKRSA